MAKKKKKKGKPAADSAGTPRTPEQKKVEKAPEKKAKPSDDDDEPESEPEPEPEDDDEEPISEPPPKRPPAAHAPAHAAHADHHHHKPDRKGYVRVWVYLAVLTVLEVGLAYLDKQLSKTMLVTGLVGLALAKAGCVALYYMHLKHETKYMRYTVGFPMVFPALYAFILIAEGTYRAIWGDS